MCRVGIAADGPSSVEKLTVTDGQIQVNDGLNATDRFVDVFQPDFSHDFSLVERDIPVRFGIEQRELKVWSIVD